MLRNVAFFWYFCFWSVMPLLASLWTPVLYINTVYYVRAAPLFSDAWVWLSWICVHVVNLVPQCDISTTANSSATFKCPLLSSPSVVSWTKDGHNIKTDMSYTVHSTNGSLHIIKIGEHTWYSTQSILWICFAWIIAFNLACVGLSCWAALSYIAYCDSFLIQKL